MSLIERSFRERIVLVGVAIPPRGVAEAQAGVEELARLVDTAGADAVARVVQRRERPDPATYVGKGKAAELHELSEEVDADTVVFDDELTPAQQRNLERILGRTAIDRTAVILDIFAQHAHSQEGKAQVELALLRYRLPRLRGRGLGLSQQAGGIGTRGPGETQLEVDRRRLVRRMTKLEAQLGNLERTRRTQRRGRSRSRLRSISLVGYTNSGKSTLLNRLTEAGVLVEDRLFATVDPRTRRLDLPGGEAVLCSDTVGFVRRLPHELVEAFHSTLEVVSESDLLVHVVDAAAPDPEGQIEAVRGVLEQIGAGGVPELLAFNKVDQLDGEVPGPDRAPAGDALRLAPGGVLEDQVVGEASVTGLLDAHPGSVALSGLTGAGVGDLLAAVSSRLRALDPVRELVVPYERGDVLATLHREGEVLVEVHEAHASRVRARLDPASLAQLQPFVVDAGASDGDGRANGAGNGRANGAGGP